MFFGAEYWTQGLEHAVYTVPLSYASYPLYLLNNKYNYIRNRELNNAMDIYIYVYIYTHIYILWVSFSFFPKSFSVSGFQLKFK